MPCKSHHPPPLKLHHAIVKVTINFHHAIVNSPFTSFTISTMPCKSHHWFPPCHCKTHHPLPLTGHQTFYHAMLMLKHSFVTVHHLPSLISLMVSVGIQWSTTSNNSSDLSTCHAKMHSPSTSSKKKSSEVRSRFPNCKALSSTI